MEKATVDWLPTNIGTSPSFSPHNVTVTLPEIFVPVILPYLSCTHKKSTRVRLLECPNFSLIYIPSEVYYLHEVCHSCTNLVHGIVPEVYYLHEVCHSCTNLVHGIVPEVYYLHEVCHSCTNLVHSIVPEVYYLHEVCHSCTNLVHGVVPEVLTYMKCATRTMHDYHRLTRSDKEAVPEVWETYYPVCESTEV